MSTLKTVEKFFLEHGFSKKKMDSFIAYSKVLSPEVEYLFIYYQSKSKNHVKGAPLHIEITSGLRFMLVEDMIQESNKDFLVSLGWSPQDFKPIKYSSVGEKICNEDESDGFVDNVLKRLKGYVSLPLEEKKLQNYRGSIINLKLPQEFSFYGRGHLAQRALVFRYLDGNEVNDNEYSEWLDTYEDLRNDPQIKRSMDQLRVWIKNKL